MLNITKERAREILNKYEINKDLFNWCEEYINWSSENIYFSCDSEIRYILDKSFDDRDAPFSYDDLDLFDIDKAKEHILYKFEYENMSDEEEQEDFLNKIGDDLYHNQDTEEERIERLSTYLDDLNKGELQDLFNILYFDNSEVQAEILEWVAVSSTLSYWLEQQGEVILDKKYWGRQTFGQAYKMDYCIMKAFISILNNIIN